jgi:hypothetical protein
MLIVDEKYNAYEDTAEEKRSNIVANNVYILIREYTLNQHVVIYEE